MSWLPVNLRNSLGRKPSRFCLEPACALEHANIAERPGVLQAPLTRSIAGLPALEHPAGRNLATVSFASSTCFSLKTLKPGVLAALTCLRSLTQNFSEAADAPPHRCP